MSEMALTADHLIVIGRGRLLADTSTQEFIDQNSAGGSAYARRRSKRCWTRSRGPAPQSRRVDEFIQIEQHDHGRGRRTRRGQAGVTVHELFVHRSSLEEAFMEMTKDSVEYHATVAHYRPARTFWRGAL